LLRFQISVNHRYVYNAIYDNLAFAINQSTIFLKSAKFDFHDNFLVNPYNLYEMVTFNRTKYVLGIYVSWRYTGHTYFLASFPCF